MKNPRRKLLSLGVTCMTFVVFAGLPIVAGADTTCQQNANGFVPLICVTQSSKLGNIYGASDLTQYVNGLFKFAIAVGAAAAVLRLAYAGYLYMGTDMWSKKGQAREIISNVTFGLLLLLGVWVILNQINPHILSLNALQNIGNGGSAMQPDQQSPGFTPSQPVVPMKAGDPQPGYFCYPSTDSPGYNCYKSQSDCTNQAAPTGAACVGGQ